MATPVPFQLAGPQYPVQVRKVTHYVRDPYWFTSTSITEGPDQLKVAIPATGPGAAGSTFPNNQPHVAYVTTVTKGSPVVYGVNTQRLPMPTA